jgi:peroxiredoxin
MLSEGERAPDVTLWTAPHERQTLAEILDGAPALFLFYLFDWSST